MNLQGYETVAERVKRFYKDHPNGAIQTRSVEFVELQGKQYVLVRAEAFRDPEDMLPGTGTAMEPIPGLNSFTRNSECEVAETSAWGRALAALSYHGSKIASHDEVQASLPEKSPEALSETATEFIAWVSKEKIPAQKIKLTLGAIGISAGNKSLKTLLKSMSDEQIAQLAEKLS